MCLPAARRRRRSIRSATSPCCSGATRRARHCLAPLMDLSLNQPEGYLLVRRVDAHSVTLLDREMDHSFLLTPAGIAERWPIDAAEQLGAEPRRTAACVAAGAGGPGHGCSSGLSGRRFHGRFPAQEYRRRGDGQRRRRAHLQPAGRRGSSGSCRVHPADGLIVSTQPDCVDLTAFPLRVCEENHFLWFSSIASPAPVRACSRESANCVTDSQPAIPGRPERLKNSQPLSAAAGKSTDQPGCRSCGSGIPARCGWPRWNPSQRSAGQPSPARLP